MRTCNCTGYMTNPGGVCCMDLPASQQPRAWPITRALPVTSVHPATIDLTCPCGASGRVEANSIAAAKSMAEQFYREHAGHGADTAVLEEERA